MAQNVYMASLAFLIPLQKVKVRYRKMQTKIQNIEVPFVLYPNAKCEYYELENRLCLHPIFPKTFYFRSKFNGVDCIIRKFKTKPWLMKLNLGRRQDCHYFLVLTISIDKVFDDKIKCSNNNYCTEFDLINLKKAIFENGEDGPFDQEILEGLRFLDWVKLIIQEIDNQKTIEPILSYSIVDIYTQQIEPTGICSNIKSIGNLLKSQFYQQDNPINTFLEQNITLLCKNGTMKSTSVLQKNFVYGLLYANDNFMMAHTDTVENVLESYYSNNKVEKYWADDESIVHIKTGSPYYHSDYPESSELKGNLNKYLPTLLDMGMLIYIKCRMQRFLSTYGNMSPQEIEDERGSLVHLFYNKLFNQTELDKRMNYFIKGFDLYRKLEQIQNIANSASKSKEIKSLNRKNNWTLSFSIADFLASIKSLISSK